MKAMLLAAGRGERLKPLTDAMPKCMVPVAGKPTLQRNIEWLREEGITEIGINLHYLPDAVTGFFRDGRDFGVQLHYSREPALLGTAGAVWAVRDWLGSEPFLVLYADNLVNCSVTQLLQRHRTRSAMLTLAVFWREDVRSSGVVALEQGDRVVAFKEKPRDGRVISHWVNAGLLLCEPRVLSYIPPTQPSDFGHEVLPALLAAGEPIYGHAIGSRRFDGDALGNDATGTAAGSGRSEHFYWIDTPTDLAFTSARLAEHEILA